MCCYAAVVVLMRTRVHAIVSVFMIYEQSNAKNSYSNSFKTISGLVKESNLLEDEFKNDQVV